MIKSWMLSILLILLVALVAVPAGTTNSVNAQILQSHSSIVRSQNSDVSLKPHEPIFIRGNSNFTVANGVVSGDGSRSNPYIIEGWRFGVQCGFHSLGPCTALGIENTTAYFILRNNLITSADTACIGGLFGVVNGIVTNNTVNNFGECAAVGIVSSRDIVVYGNRFAGRAYGVIVESSTKIVISENKFETDSFSFGVLVWKSSQVKVTKNELSGSLVGIQTLLSHDVLVSQNILDHMAFAGIFLEESSNVVSIENKISASGFGLAGFLDFPTGLPAAGGIVLSKSNNNTFYHNSLIGNKIQVYNKDGIQNKWDNGYPSGGNYWSDYAGKDNCTGPGQTICGRPDGIGDTPYTLDSSKDRYPLMHPYAAAIKVPVRLQHNVIKLGHAGKYLKVFVQLPPGVKVESIVASSIRLNDTLVLSSGTIPTFEKVKGVTMLVLSFTGVNSLVSRPGRYTIEVTGNILTATTFTQFFGFTSIHFVHSSHSRDDRNDQREFAFTDNFNYGSISSFQLDYSLVLLARNNSINSHSSS